MTKTIKELRQEGTMSTALYNAIHRNIEKRLGLSWYNYRERIDKLTPKEILDICSEKEIIKWRHIGEKRLEELKSLV